MQERLHSLLESEDLSPSRFADLIGVQRSSVSHILAGRNKPSFDFLQKTLKAFPELSADWLLLGKGSMYPDQEERNMGLFGPDVPGSDDPGPEKSEKDALRDFTNPDEQPPLPISDPSGSRKITQVLVFYEDRTFSTHYPSED